MKQKFLAGFLSLCLTLSLLPGTASAAEEAASASGTCGAEGDGSSVTWTLDDNGLLTISGTGAMANYSRSATAPWYSNVKTVAIQAGVTSIGEYAFYNCNSLTSITIPDSVTSIGDYAFYSCTSLTSITIPASVASIGEGAFYACENLASITIPDKVTSIRDYTFSNCTGLTSIAIPDGVASIGDYAFWFCTDLTSVTIPTSVASIGDMVFSDCNALTDIYYAGDENQWNSISFGYYNADLENITIHFTDPVEPTPDPDPEPVDPDEPEPDPEPVPDEPVEDVPPVAPNFPTQAPSNSSSNSKDEPEDVRDPAVPVVVAVDDTVQTQEQASLPISGTGESEMQYIVKDTEHADWIDRVDLPQYATDLYHVLTIGGDHDDLYDILISDEYQTLPAPGASGGTGTGANAAAEVESVLTLVADLNDAYSSGSGAFQEESFTGSFDVIDASSGDKAIDYGSLKEGDVVRTPSYNAIFVTSLRKDGNSNYEAELKEATTYASTAFQAFDRDCPEVFWLSGKMKLRMVTATIRSGSETYKQTYIFFTLVDADGFTVRDSAYPTQASVEAGIARREAAVNTILASVTGDTVYEQVTQLNRWLTEHNHYNTSADLLNLPNAPHECLSALEGNVGTSGPVCDGYSRAFKVLCDRLGISCVLVDGYAIVQAGSPGEFHMWNSVQMSDGKWYGVDVTWNDPIVSGVTDAKSGREREDFLLVGAETEVLGLKFSVSHPPRNQAADSGVCFTNGPTLSVAAYQPLAAASVLPFKDVSAASWYYASVQYVFEQGLMVGTGTDTFSPGQTLTRAMAWTFLSRLAGEEAAGGTPWYSGAQSWASREGVSDGSDPDGAVTRQQLVTMLWRYAGSPASSGSLDSFTDSNAVSSYAADALRWAVESGIISGMNDGTIQPDGTADRAQVAAILERFCQR